MEKNKFAIVRAILDELEQQSLCSDEAGTEKRNPTNHKITPEMLLNDFEFMAKELYEAIVMRENGKLALYFENGQKFIVNFEENG